MADISKIDTVFSADEIKYVDSAFTMSGSKIGIAGSRGDLADGVSVAEEATEEMMLGDIDGKSKLTIEPTADTPKLDYIPDLVYMYQGPRCAVLPSTNPACLKLETWLRLTNVKFESVTQHKMTSRKGQLPFVELNGEEIAESPSLLQELATRIGVGIDEWLTSEQRNISYCIITMLDNHFSLILKAWISKNPKEMLKAYNITDLQQLIRTKWPKPILNFIFKRKMKHLSKKISAVQIDVKDTEGLQLSAQEDLETISNLLGDQMFFFGSTPSTLDISVFSHIAQLVYMKPDAKCYLRDWLNSNCKNIVEMCYRIQTIAFPDWDKLCISPGNCEIKNKSKVNLTKEDTTEVKPDSPNKSNTALNIETHNQTSKPQTEPDSLKEQTTKDI